MPYNWNCFLQSADEWLITYALPPQRFIFVKLFAIGHVVELYLKASYAKLSGSVDEAIRFGHNIPKLWGACKTDNTFMSGFELRSAVLNAEILNTEALSQQLSADDRKASIREHGVLCCCEISRVARHELIIEPQDRPTPTSEQLDLFLGWK